MSLAEELWELWVRLGDVWTPYLKKAGLDLGSATEATLPALLVRPIEINFAVPGLEELSRNARRGIEPGDPARSLLYHVFASPFVVPPDIPENGYPTIRDLDILENAIFSLDFPSFADLRARAGGAPLSIGVFAYEYAPAIDTIHQRHADLCFSRTAISRIGNAEPYYVPQSRGFLPARRGHRHVHVVPSRIGVFVAVLRKGNRTTVGPEEFQDGDEDRDFWVPLHKLFNGPECVDGFDLRLEISAHHVNEKVRRVHLALWGEGVDTGWFGAALDKYPFRITENLAALDEAQGLLIPLPHPLVVPATTEDGRYVGFPVPPHHPRLPGSATLQFPSDLDARHSPEFVHVKHALVKGKIVDFQKRTDLPIDQIIDQGGYTAVNFVDFTGDGWIDARCPALAAYIPKRLPAYSVLAQPDFFPLVKQQDLFDWWANSAPPEIKDHIWPDSDVRPSPLSASRLPANLALKGANFDSTDGTITCIVGLSRGPGAESAPPAHILPRHAMRESTLSYRATDFFDPGWDIARDFRRDDASPNGTFYLANYGLGSPYMEDTLLCAALGAYWPGAVPDITRAFAPHNYPSVTPIFDRELGWDHVPPPVANADGTFEFETLNYIDYVGAMARDQVPYGYFADIELEEYVARTLSVARVYQVLNVATRTERNPFVFLSFRPADKAELRELRKAAGVILDPPYAYYLKLAAFVSSAGIKGRFDRSTVNVGPSMVFLANASTVAQRDASAHGWNVTRF
jgi:hypothetical protein